MQTINIGEQIDFPKGYEDFWAEYEWFFSHHITNENTSKETLDEQADKEHFLYFQRRLGGVFRDERLVVGPIAQFNRYQICGSYRERRTRLMSYRDTGKSFAIRPEISLCSYMDLILRMDKILRIRKVTAFLQNPNAFGLPEGTDKKIFGHVLFTEAERRFREDKPEGLSEYGLRADGELISAPISYQVENDVIAVYRDIGKRKLVRSLRDYIRDNRLASGALVARPL